MIIHVCTIMKHKLPFDHHFLLNDLSPKHWTQAVDWLTMLDCPLKQKQCPFTFCHAQVPSSKLT